MSTLRLPAVFPVAGVSFHQDVVAGVRVGDPVTVSAEPDNPYDANACAVRVSGELVGHLPRALAARIRSDGSTAWEGEVVEVIRGDHPTALRVRLDVVVEGGGRTGEGDATGLSAPTEATVSTRSGRPLGQLEQCDGGLVAVRTPAGRIVSYPADLVVVLHEDAVRPPSR